MSFQLSFTDDELEARELAPWSVAVGGISRI